MLESIHRETCLEDELNLWMATLLSFGDLIV